LVQRQRKPKLIPLEALLLSILILQARCHAQ
jgi:hypothetical protein